jgi:hypothetical protein
MGRPTRLHQLAVIILLSAASYFIFVSLLFPLPLFPRDFDARFLVSFSDPVKLLLERQAGSSGRRARQARARHRQVARGQVPPVGRAWVAAELARATAPEMVGEGTFPLAHEGPESSRRRRNSCGPRSGGRARSCRSFWTGRRHAPR